MKIFICAATFKEVRPLVKVLGYWGPDLEGLISGPIKEHEVSIFVTGVGMVNTAFHAGMHLVSDRPDLCINVGIAGSFKAEYEPGSVVEVIQDTFSELGAEDGDNFIDLSHMGFLNFRIGKKKYYNTLTNPTPIDGPIPMVKGITVNTVQANPDSIVKTIERWDPDVETMEGAAFFQACMLAELPFVAFRGISNKVGEKDRSAWKIKEAIQAVNEFTLEFLDSLK